MTGSGHALFFSRDKLWNNIYKYNPRKFQRNRMKSITNTVKTCFFLLILATLLMSPIRCARNTAEVEYYRNPVIFADYSDPDAIRVGKDFYLVSSSFAHTPGLPLLHSTDLIHWRTCHDVSKAARLFRFCHCING